jgi:hypothetical protein
MRLSKLIAGLGLIAGAVGCHHTSGTCDCMPPIQPCALYGLYPASCYNVAGPIAVAEVKPAGDAAKSAAGTPAPAAQLGRESGELSKDQY